MAEEMKSRGLSKLAPKFASKPNPGAAKITETPKVGGEGEGDMKVHTIHEHPDGHFETHMHDGTHTEHPHHLHLMAHIGHHITGGDKHHVAHHDGMGITTHGVHESGEHDGPHEHADAEEAARHMHGFMGGEDGMDDGHASEEESEEMEPSYGGM